jgi:capsular polysaccharide export protein
MLQSNPRVFLFLQGPSSPLFELLAEALVERGHRVRRVNLCFGDRLFWRKRPAVNYSGTLEHWPEFIRNLMIREKVTDLIFLGDRRPHHIAAGNAARSLGVRVFVVELGYLRPDWITLERDGMTAYSRFPVDPDAIRAIARLVPEPELRQRYRSDFISLAVWDIAYNLANVFLWPFHPHYRWHAIYHPLAEYAGWIARLVRRPFLKGDANATVRRLVDGRLGFFLFPLQLETDYQIRAHSPFMSQIEPIQQVIGSFAAHAPRGARLIFKVHPLDNGLVNWRRRIEATAQAAGVADRVITIDGGDLANLLRHAQGVITINSTVGTTALLASKPLLTLGTAIYSVPGLIFCGGLDRFWTEAQPPDPKLRDDFIRALAATTQIKGGFYERTALAAAAEEAAERLHALRVNEPGGYVAAPPRLACHGQNPSPTSRTAQAACRT